LTKGTACAKVQKRQDTDPWRKKKRRRKVAMWSLVPSPGPDLADILHVAQSHRVAGVAGVSSAHSTGLPDEVEADLPGSGEGSSQGDLQVPKQPRMWRKRNPLDRKPWQCFSVPVHKNSKMGKCTMITTPQCFLKASLWTFKSPQVSNPLFLFSPVLFPLFKLILKSYKKPLTL
jgi:hypothetical protein